MNLIETNNISFSYNNEQNSHPILKDLTLSVKKGTFVSILGPSGCGKSTLLNLLSGFRKPCSGEILFNGEKITSPFPEGQMIFQDTGQLLPWLTVEKNILFPKFRYSIFNRKSNIPKDKQSFYMELLKITGLTSFKNYYPNQLSGGLKQRVSLVRAIFAEPQILFMDEPFVSLDAPTRFELQKLLLQLLKNGEKTIFFVTHDISEALLLSDKILIFHGGDNNSIKMIDNNLKHPRNSDEKVFIDEKIRIYSLIDSI